MGASSPAGEGYAVRDIPKDREFRRFFQDPKIKYYPYLARETVQLLYENLPESEVVMERRISNQIIRKEFFLEPEDKIPPFERIRYDDTTLRQTDAEVRKNHVYQLNRVLQSLAAQGQIADIGQAGDALYIYCRDSFSRFAEEDESFLLLQSDIGNDQGRFIRLHCVGDCFAGDSGMAGAIFRQDPGQGRGCLLDVLWIRQYETEDLIHGIPLFLAIR